MSNQLTPEQAQRLTELRWRKRTESIASNLRCGWCQFVGTRPCQDGCPVHKIIGYKCWHIQEYREWRQSSLDNRERTASAVLEWVITRRDELIRVGHQILAEAGSKSREE